MKMRILPLILMTVASATRYEPNWASIDSRPLPVWYDESKIGIFLHWGVFSVPSYRSAWFWDYWKGTHNKDIVSFMERNYKPDFTYADFAQDFTAELFDPNDWADLFNASGARYVVLTSKHHEGFCNWPSKYSFQWNSKDVGANRDLVGSLAESIRKRTSLHFGLYHSLFEWFNPLYIEDKKNGFKTNNFVKSKTMPELYELVWNYKPDVIWSDGDWQAPDWYWNSTVFLAWLYNDSPVKDTVVTNDRWGKGIVCKHGGYLTCEDRFDPGVLQKRKWENAMTVDRNAWEYRRDATFKDMLSLSEIVSKVVRTVSCGGNVLINVGPTKDGRINPIFEERLRGLGKWLNVNGEAIYETKPWLCQNDTKTANVWYTMKGPEVYAILLEWPDPGWFYLDCPHPTTSTAVSLLGYTGQLMWEKRSTFKGIFIYIPVIPFNQMPCENAWVLKLENLEF